MTLSLALSYGGRKDIVDAARRLAALCQEGKLNPADINEQTLRTCMSTAHVPDVDLLIRTGGESRISDFLLYECAYAELCFMDVMWPDFSKEHLQRAIDVFRGVERRFGLTSSQVEKGLLAGVS
jgi:undecaprenyl diphosphate synthase